MTDIVEIKKTVDTLYIYWTLTDFCNFKCSYCPDDLHSGKYATGKTEGFPVDEQINNFIDSILETHLNGRFLHVTISGGEPTLHPMLPKIIERLSPHGEVDIVTNGSRSIKWWNTLPVLPGLVIISFHPEFTKIDKINELCSFLISKSVNMQINTAADPSNWGKVIEFTDSLIPDARKYLKIKSLSHIEPVGEKGYVGPWGSTYNYTNEQKHFIKTFPAGYAAFHPMKESKIHFIDNGERKVSKFDPFSLISSNRNTFKGWKCSAGSSSIAVSFTGIVYAGLCNIKRLGYLDNFAMEPEMILCTRDFCPNPADIAINKKK